MKLTELKSEFHRLIDETNDPQIVEQFFDAMTQTLRNQGSIWQTLTADQQNDVIAAYEESKNTSDLISLDELKAKYANWS